MIDLSPHGCIVYLQQLLSQKNLDPVLFNNQSISFDAGLAAHVAWVFKNIYAIPYPNKDTNPDEIARLYHGIEHVTRVAIYLAIWANLYRRYDDREALNLSNDELKLLQIAALFHDSAREDEEEDLWDHESATLFYFYLTKILHISPDKAKLLAEAITNKDHEIGKPFYLLEDRGDEIAWIPINYTAPLNIYQKLIHDSDALDIHRARYKFKGKKLIFYQKIASVSDSALDELAELIKKARSLIEHQGDGFGRIKTSIKKKYENENAYETILKDIFNEKYLFLYMLYNNGYLLSHEHVKALDLIQQNILNEKMIFARGIIAPPCVQNTGETSAALEFRKVLRRKGIATPTNKEDRYDKEGNPNRSISLLGYGGGVFVDSGGLIFNPDLKAIKAIYAKDSDTGWSKKRNLFGKIYSHFNSSYIRKTNLFSRQIRFFYTSLEETEEQLLHLRKKLKLGGTAIEYEDLNHVSTHTEILYDVTEYEGIYYSFDPTLSNEFIHGTPECFAKEIPILNAIFLQKEYFNQTKILLPLFEYSGIHDYLRRVAQPSEQKILQLWTCLCAHYLEYQLTHHTNGCLYIESLPIHEIKVRSMYSSENSLYYDKIISADSNYDVQLQQAISQAIETKRLELIKKYENDLIGVIIRSPVSLLMSKNYFIYALIKPHILSTVRNRIILLIKLEEETLLYDPFMISSFRYKFVSRLYDLCIVASLDSEFQSLKNLARNIFDREIKQFLNKDSDRDSYQEEKDKLIQFAFAYQLDHELQGQLEKLDCKLFTHDLGLIEQGIFDSSHLLALLINYHIVCIKFSYSQYNVLKIRFETPAHQVIYKNIFLNDYLDPAKSPLIISVDWFFDENTKPQVHSSNSRILDKTGFFAAGSSMTEHCPYSSNSYPKCV